ncbi:unnamed protein product, partial [Symbiodinium sp. CCMP2456]
MARYCPAAGYLALSRFAKLQAKVFVVPSRAALALSAGAVGAGALTAKSWVQPVGCDDGPNWDAIRKEIVNILDDDKYKETCLQYTIFHPRRDSVLVVKGGAMDFVCECPVIWAKYFLPNIELGDM